MPNSVFVVFVHFIVDFLPSMFIIYSFNTVIITVYLFTITYAMSDKNDVAYDVSF